METTTRGHEKQNINNSGAHVTSTIGYLMSTTSRVNSLASEVKSNTCQDASKYILDQFQIYVRIDSVLKLSGCYRKVFKDGEC